MSAENRLLRALAGIERPLLREYSLKAIGDELRTGRFLLSFPRGALGPGPSRVLRGLLAQLDAPPAGIAALDALQSRAVSLHFGLEPEASATVLKCYLEFPEGDRPDAMTFLALKWHEGAHALSEYRDPGVLEPPALAARITEALPEGPARAALMTLANQPAPLPAPLTLLEVTEPGNPRRSLDLNLSALNARLGDHHKTLLQLLGPAAAPLLAREAAQKLGHVAAGTARDGRAFATLYYGAHRVTGAL